jgi:two-component system OmpR family response regulator
MTARTILVVDDDRSVADTIVDVLTVSGYNATAVHSASAALESVRRSAPDLVVLDVNMPHVSGFDIIERLRGMSPGIPIIMLTARQAREDIVKGLKLGADDYIPKPFVFEEFVLRVAAVLRRTYGSDEARNELRCGSITLNVDDVTVKVGDTPLSLSPTEFRLLAELMRNCDGVVTRDQLLERVWGIDFDASTNVVDTYVSYLRKKLASAGASPIVTVRGFGFRLTPAVTA